MPTTMRGTLPMPARAVLARFQATDELPAWASYITSSTWSTNDADETAAVSAPDNTLPHLLPHLLRHGYMQPLPEEAPLADISTVRGRVWTLSRDGQGSRQIQKILKEACSTQLEDLASELLGHVFEAARCPHANFVLQMFIAKTSIASRAIAREFIDGGCEAILQAAKHRSGCRIVKQFLESCHPTEKNALSDVLVRDGKSLCMHRFGNYTVQQLLTDGSEQHRSQLMNMLQAEAAAMGADFHAPAVLGVALKQATRDAKALARALLQVDGLLAQMGRTKHGQSTVALVMQAVDSSHEDIGAHRRLTNF